MHFGRCPKVMKPIRGTARTLPRDNPQDHQRSSGRDDDPYQVTKKPPEPTGCPRCGASFTGRRWTWTTDPDDSFEQICSAFQRIEDCFPAGYVMLKREFPGEYRDDIVAPCIAKLQTESATP